MSYTSQHAKDLYGNPGKEASILSAQYNNVSTVPGQVAAIRGSGQWSTDYPLSSNWKPGNSNPDESSYIRNIKGIQIPDYGQQYDLSPEAPVGNWENDQWKYTKDQSSFPPVSKESLKGDPYTQFGLNVLNETPSSLSTLFFSAPNVEYLQQRIVNDIKHYTGLDIKPQNEDALLIIMQNKYQYAMAGSLPGTSVVHLALPRGQKSCSLRDRLSRLNAAVLQDAIQQVLSSMQMYITYYKDASSLPVPLDLPTLTTMKGSRVISSGQNFIKTNPIEESKSNTSFNERYNIIN